MNIKIIAFFGVLLLSTISYGQDKEASKRDSLLRVYHNKSLPDKARYDAYDEFFNHNPLTWTFRDSSSKMVNAWIKECKKKEDLYCLNRALMTKATIYNNHDEMDSSLTMWRTVFKNSKLINDSLALIKTYHLFGLYITDSTEYYLLNSARLSLDTRRFDLWAKSMLGVANYYLEIGKNVKAYKTFLTIINKTEEEKIFKPLANAEASLGGFLARLGKQEKGLEYLEKAAARLKGINDNYGRTQLLGQIIVTSYYAGEFETTKKYISEVKENPIYTQSKGYRMTIKTFETLLLFDEGRFDDAKINFQELKNWYQEQNNSSALSSCYYYLGKIEIHYNRLNEAIEHCDTARSYAIKANSLNDIKEACDCLYKAYDQIGNASKALQFLKEFTAANDSLDITEANEELIKSKFESERIADSIATTKQAQLKQAEYEKQIAKRDQRNKLLLTVGLVLLASTISLILIIRLIRRSKRTLEKEKKETEIQRQRSDELLLNILPAQVAEELKNTGASEAQQFDEVSIIFTDFKEFTQTAEKLSAKELVNEINTCFKAFDHICEKYGIEKIKTIGDSYMAAAGLGRSSQFTDDRSQQTVNREQTTVDLTLAALEMQQFITARGLQLEAKGLRSFQMRAGIHTGPVVAGIVGVKKFQYDIWGDTVNTASRMESHGEVGKVNISEETYLLLKDDTDFAFEEREPIDVKGKGTMKMYFVSIQS